MAHQPILVATTLLLAAVATNTYGSEDEPFVSATTVEEVQRQIRKLPSDDVWWTVNGEDMAWNFKNLHRIFPTVNVYRNGPVRQLAARPMPQIADFEVNTPIGLMGFQNYLEHEQTAVLGVVILQAGDIVYEHYPRMQAYEKPVYWSVAKVFVSTVVRILEERGEIDVGLPIDAYVKELGNSSFAGITIRNILDMATGLDCLEEYVDQEACYYRYSMSIGDGFRTANAPDNPYDFLATLDVAKLDEQGQKFAYSGANTFVLAWLVEEITGMPFHDAFTSEIWQHIGAESDASYIAPRYGVPVVHGGFLARMRDIARFGLLFTPSSNVVSENNLISDAHIELLRNGGNSALRINAGFPGVDVSGVKHNVYQWDRIYANDTFFKGGWAGQGLIINPSWDVVAVFTGYFKDDHNRAELDPVILDLLEGVFGAAQ